MEDGLTQWSKLSALKSQIASPSALPFVAFFRHALFTVFSLLCLKNDSIRREKRRWRCYSQSYAWAQTSHWEYLSVRSCLAFIWVNRTNLVRAARRKYTHTHTHSHTCTERHTRLPMVRVTMEYEIQDPRPKKAKKMYSCSGDHFFIFIYGSNRSMVCELSSSSSSSLVPFQALGCLSIGNPIWMNSLLGKKSANQYLTVRQWLVFFSYIYLGNMLSNTMAIEESL